MIKMGGGGSRSRSSHTPPRHDQDGWGGAADLGQVTRHQGMIKMGGGGGQAISVKSHATKA